ncbi:MAG TPA: hypothetical protein VN726_15000 [Hanamia sp.]|nr:hypothetical protein [Hanamia sp.]
MLDDENDKRIKEAAEQYHPAYDDAAWEKMSQLLDEHLPQKKERKIIFFILPSLLLVAALVFFIINYSGKKDSHNVAQNLSSKQNTERSLLEKPVVNSKEKSAPSLTSPAKPLLPFEKNPTKNEKTLNEVNPQKKNEISVSSIDQKKNETSSDKNFTKENELKDQAAPATNKDSEKNQPALPGEATKNDSVTKSNSENISQAGKTIDEKNVAKNEKAGTIKKTTKTNSGFKNNFGISISAGPDISGVKANKIGRLTAIFGAGLSYSISKNFSVRSGFYISKKIYSVEGNDYDLPGGNPNYAYLENVNANCTVYEIPVKADYNFTRIKNHNWFISTGLSSYLMKKENYNYVYKTVSGSTYSKDWAVNNKNKHFFSVLSLSGGYQYSFNKQFSFAAEPYINIPLKGVGEGKVKLNSAGILLTLKAKPFLKKEK